MTTPYRGSGRAPARFMAIQIESSRGLVWKVYPTVEGRDAVIGYFLESGEFKADPNFLTGNL